MREGEGLVDDWGGDGTVADDLGWSDYRRRDETVLSAGSWKTPVDLPGRAGGGGPSKVLNVVYDDDEWGRVAPQISRRTGGQTSVDETVLGPGSWKSPKSNGNRPFVDRPERIISAGSWKTPVNMPQSARSGGPSGVSNHEY